VSNLQTATIVAKKVYPSKFPKAPNLVVADDGASFKAWPDKEIEEGNAYEIKFKEGEYNGKAEYTIVSARLIAKGAAEPTKVPVQVERVELIQGKTNGYTAPNFDEKQRLITIQGFMHDPRWSTREELCERYDIAASVYDEKVLGKKSIEDTFDI